MAISWQQIRYGWVALASLGIITGTTIYVANNQRKQIKPQDIIEIAVGVHERCLATQYREGSSLLFHVPPPEYVREWSDGTTQTNALGWIVDKQLMIELDSKIKDLVPYFIDPVTSNALTVTGVWAELNIGDGVDQFTRTPALGTNDASYGNYPWQIYALDLAERYKVLWKLQWTLTNDIWVSNGIVKVKKEKEKIDVGWGLTNETMCWSETTYLAFGSYYIQDKQSGSFPISTLCVSNVNTISNYWQMPCNFSWYSVKTTYDGTNAYGETLVGAAIDWATFGCEAQLMIGPFPTNKAHRLTVEWLKTPAYAATRCWLPEPDSVEPDGRLLWDCVDLVKNWWPPAEYGAMCRRSNLVSGPGLLHNTTTTNDFEWETILQVSGSSNKWETTGMLGSTALVPPPVMPYESFMVGVTSNSRLRRVYISRGWDEFSLNVVAREDGPDEYVDSDDIAAISNFFGMNHFFYYCTNKYW